MKTLRRKMLPGHPSRENSKPEIRKGGDGRNLKGSIAVLFKKKAA